MRTLFQGLLGLSLSLSMVFQVAPGYASTPIKIGVPLPLTGSLAEAGGKQDRGYEMCRAAINAKGGVNVNGTKRPIEFVKYDYQSETNRALQIVQRLVTVDKVDFLFSPYGSGDTKAVSVLAERYQIPMVSSSAAAEVIFDQGLKNTFGILFPSPAISKAEVEFYVKTVPNLKRVAILSMNSLYPKSIAADIKREAEAANLTVVYDGAFNAESLDFSVVLTQIKALKADWIYVTGYTQSNVQVRRQMLELGVTAPVITMTLGPAYPEFVENLGAGANGITTATWWHANATYQDDYVFGTTQAYAAAFRAQHKYQPADVDAAATAACEVIARAIEKAGTTDREAIRKVFADTQFDTFYGPIKFRPGGQNGVSQPLLLQIRDQQPKIIAPTTMKEADFVLMTDLPAAAAPKK